MKNEQLSEFHGVNLRSTYRWTSETKHRKTVQAQADVTPDEWRLIGEIMQLVYLYNAKGWEGEAPLKWCSLMMNSMQLLVALYEGGDERKSICITFTDTNVVAQMELLKRQLEQLVYEEEK